MNTAHSTTLSTNGQPSAAYLMGAMLADGVDPDLAAKVADGYGVALSTLTPGGLLQWRLALLSKLNAGPETAFAAFAHPSEHEAPRYLALADTYLRTENKHGDPA
jgi:hypothetical protein